MTKHATTFEVYVETGKLKSFAVALDWPGWSRSGKDEGSALRTLLGYAPRYADVLNSTRLGFTTPNDISAFEVVERVEGNATTDFGAPNVDLQGDDAPVNTDELKRWTAILRACWRAFDGAVESAEGKALRKGPRGGGRDLDKIVEHVRDVDRSYLSNLGGTADVRGSDAPSDAIAAIREAILTTLTAAVRGEIPTHGPRGGKRWTPRYFVRRLAWHELDHTWEIEDRQE